MILSTNRTEFSMDGSLEGYELLKSIARIWSTPLLTVVFALQIPGT